MKTDSRIYVAGGSSLIGVAVLRALERQGHDPLACAEPDLCDPAAVDAYFSKRRPEYVFLLAGKRGGIEANRRRPAELMIDNLRVQTNVIDSAFRHDTKKLIFVSSSCSYPRSCSQPMHPRQLLTGPFEPTNEAYALAKVAGLKLCEAYRQQYGAQFYSVIATNYYGPGDHFDKAYSHVVAALMRRMHEAKTGADLDVCIWGSGRARREFVFVDDIADACVFAMRHHEQSEPLNLGGGTAMSIRQLATRIREVVGFEGDLRFDSDKPDGMPNKLLDASLLQSMGWRPQTSLSDGLAQTYQWFLENSEEVCKQQVHS